MLVGNKWFSGYCDRDDTQQGLASNGWTRRSDEYGYDFWYQGNELVVIESDGWFQGNIDISRTQ